MKVFKTGFKKSRLTFAQLGPYKPSSQARWLHVLPIQFGPHIQVPLVGSHVAPFSQVQLFVQFNPNVPSGQIFRHYLLKRK